MSAHHSVCCLFPNEQGCFSQVETLRLSWCKLGSGEGAKSVADLLLFNTTLSMVDLRGNNFGDPGAFHIARALRELTNDQLTELDLGYNEIKDEGACQLALVSVTHHTSLEYFDHVAGV